MRILMLGWEFPPFISGGLGTACRGLTDAMGRLQTRILFVLPRSIESQVQAEAADEVELKDDVLHRPESLDASKQQTANVELAPISSEITNPYRTVSPHRVSHPAQRPEQGNRNKTIRSKRSDTSSVRVVGVGSEDGYDGDLIGKIYAYADRCVGLTRRELFDVIHAHDWITFPAAIAIARFSGRPLVVHVHATEFDRSGEDCNPSIYDIERLGMQAATRVIAVSERTKRIIVQRYKVPPEKVQVVHNGIDFNRNGMPPRQPKSRQKVVLFLGRITRQKGPEFFVRAAARVAESMSDVKFVIAGTGDQLPYIVKLTDELGLRDKVEFTGFLHGAEVDRAYQMADIYAMPSVSEPFGLTALEAARHGVPVILSTSSGAAEVLKRGALKTDFWDIEMIAKMIVAVLKYPRLADSLRRESNLEIGRLTWDVAARKCIQLYCEVINTNGNGFRPEPKLVV